MFVLVYWQLSSFVSDHCSPKRIPFDSIRSQNEFRLSGRDQWGEIDPK